VANAEQLLQIKSLAMRGEYGIALACLEGLLQEDPRNVDALRLKGNVIELAAYSEDYRPGEQGGQAPRVEEAESCYREILRLDPANVLAMIDLGDHHCNLGNFDLADSMYDKAIDCLLNGHYCLDFSDEAISAYDGKIDIARTRGGSDQTIVELEQAQAALVAKHVESTGPAEK
jgi:Flp pilus assembly protein TadD